SWKWLKGPALMQTDFGDPVAGDTSYALCVYSGTSNSLAIGIPSPTGWKSISAGYSFKDSAAGGDGAFKALLKGGDAGKSKELVKAKGINLDLSALPLGVTTTLTAQLLRSDDSACWEAVYPLANVTVDSATQFKAKAP
ncbi:MAG TPA: hypothetical protein VGC36_06535, partial [Rhizomicrobium sp.]